MSQKIKIGPGFGSVSPQPKSNLANVIQTINNLKSKHNKNKKIRLRGARIMMKVLLRVEYFNLKRNLTSFHYFRAIFKNWKQSGNYHSKFK